METLNVSLGERSYPIYIQSGAIHHSSFFVPHIRASKVVVVTNPTIAPLYLESLKSTLADYQVSVCEIEDGEAFKTLATYEKIMDFLLRHEFARDVTLIALGGGVVGDITGFVAATYQRGVDFIQVPTTLLSQVDSSVGGKTAVNHPLGKNMIGAFYQPKAVVIDTDTLITLPEREFAAGMAEVVKYGILGNRKLFNQLVADADGISATNRDLMANIISQCCQDKADIVASDEKESGKRALLNLGHTFGHAIEAEMGYGNWLHGEAVAAGMVIACEVAEQRGWLSRQDVDMVKILLSKLGLPIAGPESMTTADYLKHMRKDKKVLADTIRFVLPKSLGDAHIVNDVSTTELELILK